MAGTIFKLLLIVRSVSVLSDAVNKEQYIESSCRYLSEPEMKIAAFANSVDLDEAAQHEPPHLDLHCLSSSFLIFNLIQLGLNFF